MKIKIELKNADKIEEVLKKVNGKAREHTYTSFEEIMSVVRQAERECEKTFLNKSELNGVNFISTSGHKVAKSYNHSRIGTRIQVCKSATSWFLLDVYEAKLFMQGGSNYLVLSKQQAEQAAKKFLNQFSVV